MQKILVPLDFSQESRYALKLASKIADQTNTEIYLLHMIQIPEGHIDMGSGSNISIPQSMHYIQKVKEKIIDIRSTFFKTSTRVKYAIRFETPYDGILKFSKRIAPSLIIMGSKDKSILEELLVGSLTKSIAKVLTAPIVAINKDPERIAMQEVVFASNFKEKSKKSFDVLLAFTKKFGSRIHLLNINTMQRFRNTSISRKKMIAFLEGYNKEQHSINIYNDSSIEKGVSHFSKEINADIVALSTHEHEGLLRLFYKSLRNRVSRKSSKPVLTFFT